MFGAFGIESLDLFALLLDTRQFLTGRLSVFSFETFDVGALRLESFHLGLDGLLALGVGSFLFGAFGIESLDLFALILDTRQFLTG
ncbi:MAG: hypothetical protein E2O97_09175, partial [Acidobacteria bacterium]